MNYFLNVHFVHLISFPKKVLNKSMKYVDRSESIILQCWEHVDKRTTDEPHF